MRRKLVISFLILGIILTPYSLTIPQTAYGLIQVPAFGEITTDTTWTLDDSPYVFAYENVNIYPDATLTIEAGVIVKLKQSSINVEGGLIAQGEAGNPVIFTSNNDNERGGDTNPWSDDLPQAGDWVSIKIMFGGIATLDHVIVTYGGIFNVYLVKNEIIKPNVAHAESFEVGAITADIATVNITNTEITKNTIGVQVNGGFITINNSQIYNNDTLGVINNGTEQVNATNNWWGDDSGPYHPTLNPDGQGNAVSDNVLFEPWVGQSDDGGIDPVILVPGILGSWWVGGQWVLDPILHTYDQLYQNLQTYGDYIEGETLFAFPYNWRNSNVVTAQLLRDKINEVKNVCECNKIDLVVHSMGGLVARYYIESDLYQDDVDQLVFIATPHLGSTKNYLVWEAGEVGIGYFDWLKEKILKQEAKEYGYDSLYEYIHEAPLLSVQQLLPIYDYLQDKDTGIIREYPNNYPTNQFLEWLNEQENLDKLNEVEIINIYGDIENITINNIRVVPQEPDQAPLWEHGYPDGYNDWFFGDNGLILGSGDKTVPIRSSTAIQSNQEISLAAKHLPIVARSSGNVIEVLTNKSVDVTIQDMPDQYFVAQLYSPVDFMITDPNGNKIGKDFNNNQSINEIAGAFYTGFDTDVEFIVIPNPLDGEYKIELQGTDNGAYTLSISYIDDEQDIDKNFTDIIQTGQNQNFIITYSAENENPISDLEPEEEITIDSTIDNIKEIYEQGWLIKKRDKKALIHRLKHLEKRLEHIDKKIEKIEQRIEKIENNDDINLDKKERILQRLNRKLSKLNNKRDRVITKKLNRFEKRLNKIKNKNRINQDGYDIIMSNINYLRNNL